MRGGNAYLSPAHELHIQDRRRKVAALRLRGLTYREISRALAMEPNPIYNPETGNPYDTATVCRDLKHIEGEWRQEAIAHLDEHKARHLAELSEVRRAAWQQNKLFYVLKALEQEADVLGLKHLPPGPNVNFNVANIDLTKVPTDELRRLSEVIDAATTPAVHGEPPARVIEAG